MRKTALLVVGVLLVAALAVPAPAAGQSYGGNYCSYLCSAQYPSPWDPRGIGCQVYCDAFCSQSENWDNMLCMDVQDYYS